MPVIRGQDDDPARVAGAVEQRREVPDRVGAPVGAARVGPVQGIVDRVQHAGDQRPAGHVGDGRGDVAGDREAEPGRIERLLVEQGRSSQPVSPGQRVVAAPFGVLAAGAQLTAE